MSRTGTVPIITAEELRTILDALGLALVPRRLGDPETSHRAALLVSTRLFELTLDKAERGQP